MHWPVIVFAIGIWLCQQQSVLAEPLPFFLGAGAGFLLAFLLWRRKKRRAWQCVLLMACCLCGFAYANWRAELRLADRLPSALEGQNLLITGHIVDLPQTFDHGERFLFDPESAPPGVPAHLQLTWAVYENEKAPRAMPALHAGERWQLLVRLRRAHGNVNPNGFDFEGWMFERGIGAVGNVQPKSYVRLGGADTSALAWVDRWREVIRERFARVLPDSPWRGILVALVVGDQGSIPKDQWALFRQTGTTHLMSISGLHITLVAAMVGLAVGWAWRRIPWLALRLPAQKAAVLAGALAGLAYVLLSGFSVPAQRTLYMLSTAALAMWLERTAGVKRVLASALLVVLLLDPWAVLSSGFWLSFGAVGSLLLVGSMEGSTVGWIPRLTSWVRAQWAVTLFTLPMLLALFQQFSLVSPLANAIAIPVVSMLITPLALFYGVLPLPSLAHLANWVQGVLMAYLQFCAGLPFAIWQQAAPPVWLALPCCAAALWALLPRGVPGRWAGLLLFVPLLLWQPARPLAGLAQITVLDVGQGLAVHVRTASHDLLFDTGPRYSAQSDAGERTVLPYLRAEGVNHLDMLMVSHQDSDHAGGVRSILAGLPVLDYRASFPAGSGLVPPGARFQDCLRGQHWAWDGVVFQVLYPVPESVGLGNDGSCVLRVATQSGAILLTGDIERDAEDAILGDPPGPIHAEIMVAPHHGSRSSSQEPFVEAVHARYAIFTSGYLNRYHHPAPEVVARYVRDGAQPLRSDFDGAIRFDLDSVGITVSRARQTQARYWFDISR